MLRSQGFEAVLLAGAMIFIACSGGPDQGPIAGPGPAPGEPGEGIERGDNPFDLPSGSGSSTGGSESTGSGMCVTCVNLLDGTVGQEACPGSESAIAGLFSCACAGACEMECATGLCEGEGLDAPCAGCLAAECESELRNCQEN